MDVFNRNDTRHVGQALGTDHQVLGLQNVVDGFDGFDDAAGWGSMHPTFADGFQELDILHTTTSHTYTPIPW